MEEGPEYKVPHFYVDYKLATELFKDFEIINIFQVVTYHDKVDDEYLNSYHYHLLIKKKV